MKVITLARIIGLARAVVVVVIMALLMSIAYNIGKMTVSNPQVVVSKIGQYVTQIVTYSDKKVEGDKTLYKHLSRGTAFLVSHKGKQFVVTNNHVCRDDDPNEIRRGEIRFNGVIFELEVVAADPHVDLCLLKAKTVFYDDNAGVKLADGPPSLSSTFGTYGFNGIDFGVPQIGQLLGTNIIYVSPAAGVDHKPTESGMKINNIRLSEEQRATLCVPPNHLEIIESPLQMLFPQMKLPRFFSCLMPEQQDVYSFHTVPGASGSPVIDVESGKMVGVISQWVHEQRMYAGVIPYAQLKQFLDSNVK